MTSVHETTARAGAPGWYCLRVATRRERLTAQQVRMRTGAEVFAPHIRVPRRSASAGALAQEALFPGYVFARFRYPQDARHVASTPGVLQLVAFGGPPPAVADGVIARLEHEIRRADTAAPAPGVAEGDWVRIVAGCFRGTEGRVLAASGPSRISVLLRLLGQDIHLTVPADQVAGTALPPGLGAFASPVLRAD